MRSWIDGAKQQDLSAAGFLSENFWQEVGHGEGCTSTPPRPRRHVVEWLSIAEGGCHWSPLVSHRAWRTRNFVGTRLVDSTVTPQAQIRCHSTAVAPYYRKACHSNSNLAALAPGRNCSRFGLADQASRCTPHRCVPTIRVDSAQEMPSVHPEPPCIPISETSLPHHTSPLHTLSQPTASPRIHW